MRIDMYKVIVERPRNGKGDYVAGARRRNDFEGPRQLGMRAGYGHPWLNENLSPLRRFLLAQVGRPWNKVYSEISSGIDRRNTVQLHVFAHLDDMIATQVEWRDGRWVDLKNRMLSFRKPEVLSQPMYVDPRTGLICRNKLYRSWKTEHRNRQAREAAETAARRKVIDVSTLLLLLDDEWFEVKLAPLPPLYVVEKVIDGKRVHRWKSDPAFDAVLKSEVQRFDHNQIDRRRHFYGEGKHRYDAPEVFAVSKRQLSRRELQEHGLCRQC